jgi:hypothetical protein
MWACREAEGEGEDVPLVPVQEEHTAAVDNQHFQVRQIVCEDVL